MSPVVIVALVAAGLIVAIGAIDLTLEWVANRRSLRRVRAALERRIAP